MLRRIQNFLAECLPLLRGLAATVRIPQPGVTMCGREKCQSYKRSLIPSCEEVLSDMIYDNVIMRQWVYTRRSRLTQWKTTPSMCCKPKVDD